MHSEHGGTGSDDALEELLTLIEDYHDFNPSQIQILKQPPSPIAFSKHVSRGLPSVWPTDLIPDLQKAKIWTRRRLCELVVDDVEIALTPDGRADSLYPTPGSHTPEQMFVQPAAVSSSMEEFLNKLDNRSERTEPIRYLQSQNSNLTSTPLRMLLQDIPPNFALAKDVLGEPEAINLWIGDERSVTSAHRDPYENLYIVLRGSKTFTLWPPVDEICMDTRMVRTGRQIFDPDTQSFSIAVDENEDDPSSPPKIPWVSVDPHLPRHESNKLHPYYQYARPRTVNVSQGQMLYLPSGWYHHVSQQCGTWDDGTIAPCIAINYWYDMDYEGEKYAMRQLITRLVGRLCNEDVFQE